MWALAKRWGWTEDQCNVHIKSFGVLMQDLIDQGCLNRNGSRFKLSDPQGMELSNQTLVQMLLWWDSLPEDAVA